MILGKNVRLRPIERADLPRFVKWLADPEVRDGLAMFLPPGEAQQERWFEQNLTRPTGEQAWAIDARISPAASGLLRETATEPGWAHVGSCGFHEIEWRHRQAECGILIGDRAQWGKGFGTDAMRTLVEFGFGELNLHRIFLQVYHDNARAIRSYEKVGFKTEGRLRDSNFHNGHYRDTVVMGLLRTDLEPR